MENPRKVGCQGSSQLAALIIQSFQNFVFKKSSHSFQNFCKCSQLQSFEDYYVASYVQARTQGGSRGFDRTPYFCSLKLILSLFCTIYAYGTILYTIHVQYNHTDTVWVCTIYAYVDISATYSQRFEIYRAIAFSDCSTVSLSPKAPFCLHAPPIDVTIDYIYTLPTQRYIASCHYIIIYSFSMQPSCSYIAIVIYLKLEVCMALAWLQHYIPCITQLNVQKPVL